MPKLISMIRLSTLFLSGVLITACANMKDRTELLEGAQRTYEGAVRWGHYDIVYSMHRNDNGSIPIAPESLNNYRVTSYTVLSSTVAPDELGADQSIQIKYYHLDYLKENILSQRQHWAFNPKSHLWTVTSPPPTFE